MRILVYVEKGFSYFALLLLLSQAIYPVFLLAQQWVFGDHTEFMVLVLQLNDVYREPILGFASQKLLAGERIELVSPMIVSTCFSVLPGFGPAAEPLSFRQKQPKPLTPRSASLHEMNARHGKVSQLAALKQGSPAHESVHSEGRAAGVRPWETNISGIQIEERGTIQSV